mmetsp:Transcript_32574/g.47519  ORF Transcript_32574/g.47519 Transcript_32574/m.47519 type:complete len:484 (+) Transcript_32574:188-1639(+)
MPKEVLRQEASDLPLPFPVSDLTTTFTIYNDDEGDVHNGIYLLGGCLAPYADDPSAPGEYTCHMASNRNFVFDHLYRLYQKRHDMPRARYRHTSNAVGGRIWIVGGRDSEDNVIQEVDIYNPILDTWETIGKIPPIYLRSDHTSFVLGDFLFIAGGYDQHTFASSSVLMIDIFASYDENKLKVKEVAPLHEARANAKALSYKGRGYVLGGFTHMNGYCEALRTMEIYNPHTNRWERKPYGYGIMNYGRADFAFLEYKDRFFVIGGETRKQTGMLADYVDVDYYTPEYFQQEGQCYNQALETTAGEEITVGARSKTLPVNSAEIYDPDGGPYALWTMIESGGLPLDGKLMRFVVAPWPDTDSLYAFGGIDFAMTSEGLNMCEENGLSDAECIELSKEMVVFTYLKDVPSFPLWEVLTGLAAFLVLLIAGLWYWRRRRRLRREAEGSGGKLGMDGDIALVVIPEMIRDNEEIQEEETLAEGKTLV